MRHHSSRLSRLSILFLLVLSAGAPLRAASPTLHDGLAKAREDQAADPAAVAAFTRLAKAYGTPLYVYDEAAIVANARALKAAFSSRFPKLKIHYAVKANSNVAIVALLKKEGFSGEVVSEGEIAIARRAGIAGSEILFTSSSKSPSEIARALKEGAVLNVDSRDELEQIEEMAAARRMTARVSFRINPGVDPHTIHQINTGISESKFGLHLEDGIAFAAYERAKALPHVKIVGTHCHIGSQITETSGYELAARKMLAFVLELKEKLGITLEFVDLGGGIGVPYHDGETVMGPEDLAKALEPIWKEGVGRLGYEPALWLEPGRFLVAPSGFLVTRVNSVKTTPVKTFVNVDSGFETLVRPAMYQAYHRARVIGRTEDPVKVDVAGNVCETGDILAAERTLPRPKPGDLMVILDAGAYGFSMASEYNARPLPPEVLVNGDSVTVIRAGGGEPDLLRNERTGPSPVKTPEPAIPMDKR
jgi:diaminopimelate decarboxylase